MPIVAEHPEGVCVCVCSTKSMYKASDFIASLFHFVSRLFWTAHAASHLTGLLWGQGLAQDLPGKGLYF